MVIACSFLLDSVRQSPDRVMCPLKAARYQGLAVGPARFAGMPMGTSGKFCPANAAASDKLATAN
jgi:hypothetical protein